MTTRAIIVLAVAATGLLLLGARLLEVPAAPAAVGALVSLVSGVSCAAAAVAGAWRAPLPADTPTRQGAD